MIERNAGFLKLKQKLKSTTYAALQDLDLIVEHIFFYHFWWKISLYPAKGNLNLNGIFSFLSVNDEN